MSGTKHNKATDFTLTRGSVVGKQPVVSSYSVTAAASTTYALGQGYRTMWSNALGLASVIKNVATICTQLTLKPCS